MTVDRSLRESALGYDLGMSRRALRHWLMWLFVLLFPVPFAPWWLGIICVVLFLTLFFLLRRNLEG